MLDGMLFTDRFGYQWRKHESYQHTDPNAEGWLAVDHGDGRSRPLPDVVRDRGFENTSGVRYLMYEYKEVSGD